MLEAVVDCLDGVQEALDKRGITPGAITHSIAQLIADAQAQIFGAKTKLEQAIVDSLGEIKIDRRIDIIAERTVEGVKQLVHTEIKTGENLASALSQKQMTQDAAIAFKKVADETVGRFANVWRLEAIAIGEEEKGLIASRLQQTAGDLLKNIATPQEIEEAIRLGNFEERFGAQIQEAVESFRFIDSAGNVFEPALKFLFGENGPIAQVALEKASHSPDFDPAMNVLFDKDGKMTKAATRAAGDADLAPAFKTLDSELEESARHATAGVSLTAASAALEDEIEQSVGGAIRGAGDTAARISTKELGDKIGDRASALGNALSSIPQLHRSVKELGAAWDKPNKSTEDYMALLEAAGSTIGDAGNVIQSLTALTGAASAAQTLFNIVLSANPIGLVVLAVIALIAEIALLIAYWDEIRAVLRDNPWIGVVLALFSVIGVIVLVIAYWEEVKLAVLQAANFISIQAQRIGIILGQVWGAVTGGLESAGVSILNAFTTIGVTTQNFFIGIINWILDKYNELADSAAGELAGLEKADLLPEVELEARLLPLPEVPEVDIDAVLRMPVTGGLEEQIGDQERAVAAARAEDEARRSGIAEPEAQAQEAAPEAGGLSLPDLSALRQQAALAERPAIPEGALPLPAAAGGGGPVTVNLGGVTVNLNAEKLEANASQMLSDEIVRALSERLGALLAEQNFRMGTRPA